MSTPYHHHWIDHSPIDLPVGKAVCVGRNYAEHARELGNEVPDAPLLFMKPASAMVGLEEPLVLPQGQGAVHHEVEMVVLIGERLKDVDADTARHAIRGYGLGLDLTLREVQNQLKDKGHPWERAKAFDGALPLTGFVDARGISVRQNLDITLLINDEVRQHGHTGLMLMPTFELVSHISRSFSLEPGDIVLTGTPAGVGPLVSGDQLFMRLGNVLTARASVA
jgi:2-keto-4-pentenoate hydratase/2-oxohepta-3-ene-1,7-dioic acid hydratase in catechol pathway